MKTSEIFRRAAKVLDELGLAKGSLSDSQGRVCFVGALNVVHFNSPYWPAGGGGKNPGVDAAQRYFVNESDKLAEWNDLEDTTKDEVVEALTWCAFLAEDEERGAP